MTDEVYLAVVRKRIRKARLSRDLRQEDVAEKLGISVRSYQRYEMDGLDKRFNPYAVTLRRIAAALGQDVGDIVREPTAGDLSALGSPEVRHRAARK